MQTITTEERRRRLGRRHHLETATTDLTTIAGDLVGIHSSDPVTVYLSCQARCNGFTTQALEDHLYSDRTLIRRLGMRRTLFVVPTGMASLLQSGCGDRYVASERRRLLTLLADQHGYDDAWLRDVEKRTLKALEEKGEATARELTAEVPELGIKIAFGSGAKWAGEFGLSTRVLFFMATDGRIVRGRPRGSWVSSQYAWVRTGTWLGSDPEPVEAPTARGELVARWLATYGPGTLTDIKWWSGWGVRETREALDWAGAAEVALPNGNGWVARGDTDPIGATAPYAALLPSLDSTPMGWKERDWYVGDHVGELFDRNGNIGPTIWVNGRVVGGWAQRSDGEIRLGLLEPISAGDQQLVDDKAQTLTSWLGERRFTARFRTPLEKRLLG